jgi:hypothetical protein
LLHFIAAKEKETMYVVMKDGKYLTDDTNSTTFADCILWNRHPATAKVWKEKRSWAEKAANRWGGEVVKLSGDAIVPVFRSP